MATSAFKSTTKRASIGGSTFEDSAPRSLRRSRSLSRFSRPVAPETEIDYNKDVPRGKFVNTTRGSTAPFPEISLDDLALEFFSSSSKNESDGGVVERSEREGRSVSRRGEIGRWASDTASSRRKGRSVSRGRGDAVSSSSAASGVKNAVSSDTGLRRRRSVSVARSHGNAVSSGDRDAAVSSDAGTRRRRSVSIARSRGNAVSSGDKDAAVSSEAGTRRRRSLSVARYRISDSESDLDRSRNSSNRAAAKVPIGGNTQLPLASKATASSYRRPGRSRSQIDLSLIHDGYSVRSVYLVRSMFGIALRMTLGLPHGHQWHNLINSLAKRQGPPPRLRITAVGLCTDKFRAVGDELEAYAVGLGLKLEFSVVHSNLENLNPNDIKVVPGETLVVNSILQLHCVVKESRGALNSVLQIIHVLSPKVLVLVEQDSSHNGPFFLGRFMEALHYYSAIFDSLDAMLPKYDTKRAKMEQFYFAEEIKNIVSCEGPARVERHERVDQWRRRMSRAGFQPVPLKMVAQAKQWLSSINACEGYTTVEEKGCLVLGWKSKPIIAASCWKC